MVMINWKTGFVSSNSVCNQSRDSQQIGLPLQGPPSLLITVRLQTVLDNTQSHYHYKLYRYKIKPCSKTKRMTYLDPDTFMNNIKSCKFLKTIITNHYLFYLFRYGIKGEEGVGKQLISLEKYGPQNPDQGGWGGGLLLRAGPAVIGFILLWLPCKSCQN